jgi:hypothetical protein
MLSSTYAGAPLSALLRADESDARLRVSPNLSLAASYKGKETVQGLACHVVEISIKRKRTGKLHAEKTLWLAEERNLIPVKETRYEYRGSKRRLESLALVTSWTEVSNGLWFPKRIVDNFYDTWGPDHGAPTLFWRRVYAIESIRLDPDYPISFFRDIEFPAGTPVYEIVDGEIVRSYVQGREQASVGASGRRWLAPLALAALAVIGLAVAAVWFYARRRSAA